MRRTVEGRYAGLVKPLQDIGRIVRIPVLSHLHGRERVVVVYIYKESWGLKKKTAFPSFRPYHHQKEKKMRYELEVLADELLAIQNKGIDQVAAAILILADGIERAGYKTMDVMGHELTIGLGKKIEEGLNGIASSIEGSYTD